MQLPCDMETGTRPRAARFPLMLRERRRNDNNSADRKNSMKHLQNLFLISLGFLSTGDAAPMAHPVPRSSTPVPAEERSIELIERLNGQLLKADSATATLQQWCADHCLATPAKIVARRITGTERAPDPETRRRLKAENGESIRYRHVQLVCGKHILSEADNWYVPARLPAETNLMLETGDTPFGKAIRSLRPRRETISAKILWSPPPAAPGAVHAAQIDPPPYLVEHRALILTADQTPVSEVDERYTREILDFGACETAGPATR